MRKKSTRSISAKIRSSKETPDCISYRLKCTKTANGLSHFVMYGDVSKDKILL